MDQVRLVENYLQNVFKGCLPQILLGPFLNTLTHLYVLSEEIFIVFSPIKSFLYLLNIRDLKSCKFDLN